MNKKAKYRVRNWSEYNKSLINRGNLTFWIEEGLDKVWLNTKRGSYDTHRLYFEAHRNRVSAIIPPRKTAKTLKETYANPPPEESQKIEHKIACSALNRMTALGMLDSVKV